MAKELLFVCGSLSPGMVHFSRIEKFVSQTLPAQAVGSVYRLEVGYPVFMAEGDQSVSGCLVELQSSEILWPILDEFHGVNSKAPEKSLFFRKTLTATISSGPTEAFVYSANSSKLPKAAQLIADGDWQKSLTAQPPLTADLTERQRTYIQRVGASTGRDIIPINLDLYRELMNKGMIVDKGRRLALSKLGQEVYRFLQ